MPERLDRVRIQLASQPEPLEISWDTRNELLDRLSADQDSLEAAFLAVGASRPVTLELADKEALLSVIEAWGAELGDYRQLPAGLFELRNALINDLHDAGRGP
jgi:hypothetical protein